MLVAEKDTVAIAQQSTQADIDWLNAKYAGLTPDERINALYSDFDDVLFTSSFGTTAVFMLHKFHQLGIDQKVHFVNTSYHFKETLEYKARLSELFEIEVIDLHPDDQQHSLTRTTELWKYDADQCCGINKVAPLSRIKGKYQVWVSGLMGWQSGYRKNLKVFEQKNGILKFYPIIDVSEEEVLQYIQNNKLPEHPLKPVGYESIGCKHCTIKGEKRKGRWAQKVKTECGLHV